MGRAEYFDPVTQTRKPIKAGSIVNDDGLEYTPDQIKRIDDDLVAHKADYIHLPYSIADGINNYTTLINGIASLVEGMSVKIKFTNANTGASTLNINGLGAIPIKKSNGNDLSAGNIKAGQIAHLVYTGSVFQLLGEGGEYGTAQAQDVLEGKTIGTEEGLVTGTMPNRGAINRTITTQGGQIIIPEGYHNGSGYVKALFANLVPGNIKNGVNIGGVVGIFGGNMEAYLETTSEGYNSSSDNHYIEVPFQPETVIATIPYWNRMFFSGLDKILPTGEYSKIITYGVIRIASLFNTESNPRSKFRADGNGISYSNGKLYLKPEVFGSNFAGSGEESSKRAHILALRRI